MATCCFVDGFVFPVVCIGLVALVPCILVFFRFVLVFGFLVYAGFRDCGLLGYLRFSL